ncbi:MAG: ribonuclease [Acidobacteriota bacterium]|jgi:exoribonuclease-2|nr:ribonuclease [Acidobacteriota bacterium]
MDRNGLREIARRVLTEHGFAPDFPARALAEAEALPEEMTTEPDVEDLRKLPWLSIDNQGTRTLDQITTAERRGHSILVRIAIADVDALVPPGSALDHHARYNTRSVYTPGGTFPLLPERIATGLGSFREGRDRLAVAVELLVEEDGSISSTEIRRAWVRNQARLAYEEVADWLEDKGPLTNRQMKMSVLKKQLRLHEEAAGNLRRRRYERGALPIERWRLEPVFHCEERVRVLPLKGARAQELIEDLMVATNEATAAFLAARGLPSLRRLVRAPERWPRLMELASGRGNHLPAEPDSAALAAFLEERRLSDPEGYPDLALAVLHLVGLGEYVADLPGRPLPRHFSLAVDDYAHSTAPNRRYADLVTQRLLKSALAGRPSPYAIPELEDLAGWCTRREDDAGRVERQVEGSAGALLLADRIGEKLEAVVIGVNCARACDPPVAGRLATEGLDVGDRVWVRVAAVDVEGGVVDFSYPS